MKIKVGDRVKFLNDTGAGVVTRIIDQKTALVQIDGGFEVPWLIQDLVVDAGRYDNEQEEVIEEKIPQKKSFSEQVEIEEDSGPIDDEELVLAFLPDKNSSEFSTYLINSSSYLIKYVISRQQEGELVLFQEGTLEPGTKINLGTYIPGNLNDEEIFRVQGLFFNSGFYRHISPLDALLKISAADMYDGDRRSVNDYFHEKAIIFTLYSWKIPVKQAEIKIDPEELKKAMLTKGDIVQEKVKPEKKGPEEVDLHIESLSDDHRNMSNGEILELQLSRFRTALESARIHKAGRIVFIHGVGNGKLKHELRRILDSEYKALRYQDASFKEYGYGATMVLL